MSAVQLLTLSPLLVVSGTVTLILLVVAVRRKHLLTATLTAAGLLVALCTLPIVYRMLPGPITPLITVDGYAIFFMGLLFAASLAVTLMSYQYLERQKANQDEYYVLMLLATLGSAVIVVSTHFVSFFLGLEILSVSLYALIAYTGGLFRTEAGIKYLILAAASDAFLLFGIALIYAETGTMEFARMGPAIAGGHLALLLPGTSLFVVGLGFKLSLVPFHMWTPDVYQGAPAPVTALLASVSKGAVFAVMLRYFTEMDIHSHDSLMLAFTLIAIASMFVGNLLALLQNHVKRILAYSSIAHLGYLLVALVAGGELAVTAAVYYLAAYFVTIIGAFGVIAWLSEGETEADAIDCYRGLVWKRPWVAGVFIVMLLSLAGIPLTAGFVGKFYVMAAGIGATLWLLIVSLVVSSVIGLFYYLRVVALMFTRMTDDEEIAITPRAGAMAGGVVLAMLTLILIWLGTYPAPLIDIITKTVVHLT